MEEPVIAPQVPKLPLVILIDRSASMRINNRYISALEALSTLREQLLSDSKARLTVELSIMTFGGPKPVEVVQDWVSPSELNLDEVKPHLEPYDETPLFQALYEAALRARERREYYKRNGIMSYVPWLWVITDGFPTDCSITVEGDMIKCGGDNYEKTISLLRELVRYRRLILWFVIVGPSPEDEQVKEGIRIINYCVTKILDSPHARSPIFMRDIRENWQRMAIWLSRSLGSISRSQPGEQVKITKPDFGEFITIQA